MSVRPRRPSTPGPAPCPDKSTMVFISGPSTTERAPGRGLAGEVRVGVY
jgi:hypothetical protein